MDPRQRPQRPIRPLPVRALEAFVIAASAAAGKIGADLLVSYVEALLQQLFR